MGTYDLFIIKYKGRMVFIRKFLLLFLVLFFALLVAGSASAATINVNNSTANAISNAVSSASAGDTLNLSAGTYYEHDIIIDKNLNITGPVTTGEPTAVIDAQQQGRIFYINSGVTVNIQYLTITNGTATSGGGIYNYYGTCTITDSTITKNFANYGGGIYNTGTCTVTGSIINNNTADGAYGGGIYNYDILNVTNSTVNGNTAYCGGGIYNGNDGTCTVIGSTISGNTSLYGGGIDNYYGTCTVTNSTINENTAYDLGGGIYNTGTCTVTGSTINGNAATYGGGIDNYYGTLNVSGCDFEFNQAFNGKAIYNSGGDTSNQVVQFCRFYDQENCYEIYAYSGTMDAQYNWWGSNKNPISKVYGDVDVSPWLVLDIDASPVFIGKNDSSTITANLWYDSDGNYHNPTGEHIKDGIPVSFYTTIGIISTPKSTSNGSAVSTLTAGLVSGEAGVYAFLDDQFVKTYVVIDATSPTVTAIDPKDNAVINDTSKVVTVTFNEAVQEGTAYDNISITCNGTPISVVTSLNDNILTITNTETYTDGTYTITIPSGAVMDVAGNGIDTYTSQFTVDTTSPEVTVVDPLDGAVINDTGKVVTVTFSKDILEGTSFDDISISLNGTPLTTITKSISGNVLTLTNTASYTDGTYTVYLPVDAVIDEAGNALETNFSSEFTIDTVALTVTGIDPVNGAVINDTGKVVTVTFSKDILEGTSFDDISISLNGTPLTTINKTINGNVLSLTNTAGYADGTYTVNIPVDAVIDEVGNALITSFSSNFTIDTVVPVITDTDPVNDATNVAADKVITVTFSEYIKWGTSWIELLDRSNGTAVDFTSAINGNVLTITPTNELTEALYKVIVHTGSVTDMAGNMVAGKSFYFSVGTSPTITATSPLDGATNVNVAKTITVTFSEPIRKSSHFWVELVDNNGTPVAFTTYITGGNILVIDPTANLAAGTTYKVKLHTGCVTDLAGNPVAPYIFSFTTKNT